MELQRSFCIDKLKSKIVDECRKGNGGLEDWCFVESDIQIFGIELLTLVNMGAALNISLLQRERQL